MYVHSGIEMNSISNMKTIMNVCSSSWLVPCSLYALVYFTMQIFVHHCIGMSSDQSASLMVPLPNHKYNTENLLFISGHALQVLQLSNQSVLLSISALSARHWRGYILKACCHTCRLYSKFGSENLTKS